MTDDLELAGITFGLNSRQWQELLEKQSVTTLSVVATALGPDLREALRIWHDELGHACVAHAEGLSCCVDDLLDSLH